MVPITAEKLGQMPRNGRIGFIGQTGFLDTGPGPCLGTALGLAKREEALYNDLLDDISAQFRFQGTADQAAAAAQNAYLNFILTPLG